MGPRRSSRGEQDVEVDDVNPTIWASMGPRRSSRGEHTPGNTRLPHGSCFNGATAFEPWRTCTFTCKDCFEFLELQWGHGVRAVENKGNLDTFLERFDASMGPRRSSRGELRCHSPHAARLRCFNGA